MTKVSTTQGWCSICKFFFDMTHENDSYCAACKKKNGTKETVIPEKDIIRQPENQTPFPDRR